MNIEEVQRAPPPPPPSRPLGFEQSHSQSSQKMNEEGVPQAPPPPPPPPSALLGRYHNQFSKKVNREVPPPPPPPPPPRPFNSKPFINQNRKRKEERKLDQVTHTKIHSFFKSIKILDQNPTENPTCPLSHPTHPHKLYPVSGRSTEFGCLSCGRTDPMIGSYYEHFICKKCDVEFHHGCHMFPRKFTHPYHLRHPLTFTFRSFETGIVSDGNIAEYFASAALSDSSTSEFIPNKSSSVQVSQFQSDKCGWCERNIEGNWYYRCSICAFILDIYCFQNIPLLVVANPKSHHHSLVFYPRPLLNPCDACGLVNGLEPSYACFQCDYMVHQSCIDLPRVIKITRHQHRLSHTPYLQSTISPCRICYKTVDTKYGLYSCSQGDCSYVVHSKCATHENVWDGNELEWEPEEPNENIFPFITVGIDLIKHFSHDHHLKLVKYDGVRDAEKQCQACVLPIDSHDFYNCIECSFFLHEVCAGLLRKLGHALHVHPLVLYASHSDEYNDEFSVCSVCSRKFSGSKYKCSKVQCVLTNNFQIDARCALVPDYFTHKAHEHPIFISTSNKDKSEICCEGCKKICLQSYLQCSGCKFAMCYECATIPNEVRYKYDKHPLFLCYGERVPDGIYWCEVCEGKVNSKDWFYSCNKCCITLHRQCVFGSSAYMKPGSKIHRASGYDRTFKTEVIRNSKNTRPICTKCRQRCPSSVYYQIIIIRSYKRKDTESFCSLDCLAKKGLMWLMGLPS